MSTKTQNGTGTKADATPTDSAKGAGILKAITETKELQPNPIQDRLRKIHECQVLTEQRKTMMNAQDTLRDFEMSLNGESDQIHLTNPKGQKLPIQKPDAVKKVVALLKNDVDSELMRIEIKLLTAF